MKLESKRMLIVVMSVICICSGIYGIVSILGGIMDNVSTIEGASTNLISTKGQVVCYIIIVITSMINLALSRNIEKHKVVITLLCIVQFLIGNSILTAIVLIALFKKTTDIVEDDALPVIGREEKRKKIFYAIIFILAFIFGYTLLTNYLLEKTSQTMTALLAITNFVYIAAIIGPIVLLWKDIKKDFKIFKKNFNLYMSYMIPKLGIFVIVYSVTNIILNLIIGQEATNQTAINEIPIYFNILLALIYAPIVEECMFRGLLRKSVGNTKIFIILSTLLFGFIHIAFAETNWMLYLYGIAYGMIGYFFAKMYAKTDNICVSISAHFIWNTIAVISSLLLLI